MRTYRTDRCNSRVTVNFGVAGFRPGWRGPFVSAKVAKTIDVPSGLIRGDGCKLAEGGPTRWAQTRSAADEGVPPFGQPAGVRQRGRCTQIKKFLEINWNHTGKNAWWRDRIELVAATLMLTWFSVLPGFAPAGEALLFRQKWPKPLTPRLALYRGDGRKLGEGGPTRRAQTRSAGS